MKRRDFLTRSLALTGTAFAGSALMNPSLLPAGPLVPMRGEQPEKHLTAYVVDQDPKVTFEAWIRRDNVSLTSYRAFQHQKYPYFYPLAGPVTGLSLVSETSLPWPHHRGVFFGLDKVNGGNYWQNALSTGQIVSQGVSLGGVTESSCVIMDGCLWKKPDSVPIMEDTRHFTLQFIDGTPNYLIDAVLTLKALVDVKVEKTNHGLFGVRCTPDIAPINGGNMVNANGQSGEGATLGQTANWMAFYGKRANLKEEIVEGVAVLMHPKYPDPEKFPVFKDCPWFTRDYGNFSPTPFNFIPKDKPFLFPEGSTMELRYRTVAFAGTPQEAKIDALWQEFAATS